MSERAQSDGVQRWLAGMPWQRTLDAAEIGEVHHKAIRRARWMTGLFTVGIMGFAAVCSVGVAADIARSGLGVGHAVAVALVAATVRGMATRLQLRVGWELRAHTRGAGPLIVDRYVGWGSAFPYVSEDRGALGRPLTVDVLRSPCLVLSVDGAAPPRAICGCTVNVTASRLQGTPQGVERALTFHERLELDDLARHDSVWVTSRSLVVLLGVIGALALVMPYPLNGFMTVFAVLGALLVAAAQRRSAHRRQALVHGVLRDPSVVGGRRKNGQAVEVLMPGKLLWTEGDRPAPERLRLGSRALERYIETGSELGTGPPTSF